MSTESSTELEILAEVIAPEGVRLDPDDARVYLKWKFPGKSIDRMNWLASRNSRGELTLEERQELERFLRVGAFIDLIQARARLSLQQL